MTHIQARILNSLGTTTFTPPNSRPDGHGDCSGSSAEHERFLRCAERLARGGFLRPGAGGRHGHRSEASLRPDSRPQYEPLWQSPTHDVTFIGYIPKRSRSYFQVFRLCAESDEYARCVESARCACKILICWKELAEAERSYYLGSVVESWPPSAGRQ